MDKKNQYIRCPRCELNYIQKKDKLCSVCQAELSAKKEDLIDDLDLELCPICKTNYIQSDEIMCASCLKERGISEESNEFTDTDEWNNYLNQEEDGFILPNEDTGELAIVDLGDEEDLDEDLVVIDDEDEFVDAEEEEEEEVLDEDDDLDIDIDLDEDDDDDEEDY